MCVAVLHLGVLSEALFVFRAICYNYVTIIITGRDTHEAGASLMSVVAAQSVIRHHFVFNPNITLFLLLLLAAPVLWSTSSL